MSMTPPPELERAVRQRQGEAEGSEIRFRCPYPDRHNNADADPSARYDPVKGVWFCDVCKASGGWMNLAGLLGVDYRSSRTGSTTSYGYTDEDGTLLYEVVRRVPKDFRQRRPDGRGGWIWSTKGVRKVLYRLPEVIAAVAENRTVYVVEGEKDSDNLRSLGLVATTNAGGAGAWNDAYTEALRGARVVIHPDNDRAGASHAQKVAEALHGVASDVRIVELPDLPVEGDVSDWLDKRTSDGVEEQELRAELDRLAEATPPWKPTDAQGSSRDGADSSIRGGRSKGADEALRDLWALGSNPTPTAVQRVLAAIAKNLNGTDPLAIQTSRERAISALKGKVSAPAKFVDAALRGVAVAAPQRTTPGPGGGSAPPYRATEHGLVHLKATRNGEVSVPLTNFTAEIVGEVRRDDGAEVQRSFEIAARHQGQLHRFEVASREFPTLRWVSDQLGATAILSAGMGTKDHARAAIQHLSGEVAVRTVFTHLGWRRVDDTWCYLHSAGGIGPAGPVSGIETDLPRQLLGFTLPEPPEHEALRAAVTASLPTLDLLPDAITLPLFCAVLRAPLEAADFSVHLAGQTGEGKSELAALMQQHFGPTLNARHLPASWSSTGNSLEALAFVAKDALLVIDDFAPAGTRFDVQRMHREAARLLRAQGNRSGRGRLRPDGTLRSVKAPRGLVLSTGEDIPGGHSIRARTFVLDVASEQMDWDLLTNCQKDAAAGLYARAMAGFLQWLAPRYDEVPQHRHSRIQVLRDQAAASTVHRRTPTIVAELAFGLEQFVTFARETAVLSEDEANQLWSRGWAALGVAAAAQAGHLMAQDPVQRFLELLRSAISSGAAHVASEDGGEPGAPVVWGWRAHAGWQPQGVRVGWLRDDDLFLDPDTAYKAAEGMSTLDGLSVTSRTLWKRMNERGVLVRVPSRRETLKVRVTLGGARRSVLHLKASTLLPQEPDQPAQVPSIPPVAGAGSWAGSDGPGGEPDQRTGPQGPMGQGISGTAGQVGQVPASGECEADDWGDV